MSFRQFIYYCALCGAWAAFAGWALGRVVAGESAIAAAGVMGMCLGLSVALALGLVDALWNFSARQVVQVGGRVVVALLVGAVGGLIGGVLGQLLYGRLDWSVFLVLGWAFTGFLIGASVGVFDVLAGFVRQQSLRGAVRKLVNGVLGGTAGGALGGVLAVVLRGAWAVVFGRADLDERLLWSPSATGFVALGACIGLLIGLAQVILKETWIRVESGFRPGRELILSRPEITVGRGEACDIGLFGDPAVEKLHARIVLQGDRYLIADAGSRSGTFLNDRAVYEPTPLTSGDEIRVGGCVLRFGERRRR